ncbi:MAG: hypothetical protein A2287_09245 [Candidatus Melainabacteria bacterium RIFOXYA12_FULL_32_12]|nr:MAG: hypothetical protein A2287_09245 [Candidatus Melainabacteria bacterium RIFOXYA12_FULL_32_12]
MAKYLVLLGLIALFSQPVQAQMMNPSVTNPCAVCPQTQVRIPVTTVPTCPVATPAPAPNVKVIREGVPIVRGPEVDGATGAAAPIYVPYGPCGPTGGAAVVVPATEEETGFWGRLRSWLPF